MPTGTPGTTARVNNQQQVGYLRFAVNYNDPGVAAGVGKQTLPAGAVIVGTDVLVTTAFNGANDGVAKHGERSGGNIFIYHADMGERIGVKFCAANGGRDYCHIHARI